MRRFITAGLVGTAQTGGQLPPDDAPSDAMVSALGLESVERAYLLRAGATAVRQAAGYKAIRLQDIPAGVVVNSQPFCNQAVEHLIEGIVAEQKESLLVEALDRLRRSGQTLAPALLPAVLSGRSAVVREAAKPVLGERGRWLSQFNPDWRWATNQPLTNADEPTINIETRWQEGTTDQRADVLRRLRPAQPGQAREWLVATWKREKADARAALLKTLAVSLSLEDEPVLESALDDRAATVREVARDLLASLPGSAFAQRLRERAEQMLYFSRGAVDAKPPTTLPADWQRDGIGQKAAAGHGERASWLTCVLSMVPCAVWTERFSLSPEELVGAVESSSWRDAMLEGWTRAAASFREVDWALVLWRWWAARATKGDSPADRDTLRELVAPFVPAPELEAFATSYLTATSDPGSASFEEALSALPTPWSVTFGRAFLSALRTYIESLGSSVKAIGDWNGVPAIAALALPAACFPAALEPFALPESAHWSIHHFRAQLTDFVDTISLRQQLYEEIPLP